MNPTETQSILTFALLAAFADGDKHDRERDEIKRIAEGLSTDDAVRLPTLYQDVLLKRVTIASAAAGLASAESRQLAYEMAVCVCDADGVQTQVEQRFLEEARTALGLAAPAAAQFSRSAEDLAGATPERKTVPGADLDKMILDAAILNGALELLPETLSTMAIIPLQMKLVYGIGQAHGFDLDRGHVQDFLATAGVGLTSQFLERAGRKLVGGLLGRLGGGLLGGLGNQALSSGMSFASTYALGQVARRYYAGGRSLTGQMLKDAYADVIQEGRSLQGQYLPAIREQARTLNPSKLLAMVRGAREPA